MEEPGSEYGRSCHRTEETSSRMEYNPTLMGMGDYALEYGLGIGIDYEILYRSFFFNLVCCSFCAPSWHLKLSLFLLLLAGNLVANKCSKKLKFIHLLFTALGGGRGGG